MQFVIYVNELCAVENESIKRLVDPLRSIHPSTLEAFAHLVTCPELVNQAALGIPVHQSRAVVGALCAWVLQKLRYQTVVVVDPWKEHRQALVDRIQAFSTQLVGRRVKVDRNKLFVPAYRNKIRVTAPTQTQQLADATVLIFEPEEIPQSKSPSTHGIKGSTVYLFAREPHWSFVPNALGPPSPSTSASSDLVEHVPRQDQSTPEDEKGDPLPDQSVCDLSASVVDQRGDVRRSDAVPSALEGLLDPPTATGPAPETLRQRIERAQAKLDLRLSQGEPIVVHARIAAYDDGADYSKTFEALRQFYVGTSYHVMCYIGERHVVFRFPHLIANNVQEVVSRVTSKCVEYHYRMYNRFATFLVTVYVPSEVPGGATSLEVFEAVQ